MPRLSDFQTEYDSIMRHQQPGYQRTWMLNQLLYRMEREYNVVPLYDDTGFKEAQPAAYDLYMEIRESRYTEEIAR